MATSFAPKDFGRAAWHGGPAILTDPVFKYRTFTPQVGRNAGQEVKNVTFYAQYVDPEGNEHRAQYDVGSAEYCQIKSSPDEGADEAEIGPSIANPDPARKYLVYPDSDFGKFITSLVNGGFDESKLLDGDITVLDGLDVEIFEQPRKEGDKFPLLLVKPGSVKTKASAKAPAKQAANDDEVRKVAEEFVTLFLAENGGTTTQAALVRGGMNDAEVKASGKRSLVIPMLQKADFLNSSDQWTYNPSDKTLTLKG